MFYPPHHLHAVSRVHGIKLGVADGARNFHDPMLSRTVVPRVVSTNGTIGEFIKEAGRCFGNQTSKTPLIFNYGQHGNSRTADGKLLLNRNNRGASNGSTLV